MCGSGYIDAKRRQFLRVDVSKTAESLIRYLTVMSSPRPSPSISIWSEKLRKVRIT